MKRGVLGKTVMGFFPSPAGWNISPFLLQAGTSA